MLYRKIARKRWKDENKIEKMIYIYIYIYIISWSKQYNYLEKIEGGY